ncbi:hypothetical protein HU200_062200 [Digitaria exilis]|uniref:Uncharacterized protein n=1 Tax=Digitaria exilis TaxID=1010633 RepID=A0A835A7Q0_9POAL|nr:hypothetical protein HU200_062200 [Digitaria exilis]
MSSPWCTSPRSSSGTATTSPSCSSFTIVLVVPPPGLPGFGTGVTDRIAASNPAISFHTLPPIPDDAHLSTSGKKKKHPFLLLLHLMERYNDALGSFLGSIPRARLHSLVTTMFTTHAVDVASKLNTPAYTFFTSAAATLAVLTQLPALLAGRTTGLVELGEEPLEHLMPEVLPHPDDDELCRTIVNVWTRIMDADGVLVNTFEWLEAGPVQALMDPRCVPGRVLPPVYCIGPLVGDGASGGEAVNRHECSAWLDAQPARSVVFLCFGSRGSLSVEQIREIATGLEMSRQRFLWAFVTHCGWNSTLEAIMAGVPLLCWPLYAEQMLNKVLITVAMGIGVELEGYKAGFIKAAEVETKVRLVMESQEGRELRARVVECKKQACTAMEDGGSSDAAFSRFLSDVENLAERV